MKQIVTSVFLFASLLGASAQDYAPFSQGISKRFVNENDSQDSGYYFSPAAANMINDTIYFRQYNVLGDYVSTDGFPDCQPWGGPYGYGLQPLWTGRSVKWSVESKTLIIQNEWSEDLTFDLSLEVGDSALILSGTEISHYLKCVQWQSEVVLGQPDMIKTFDIRAYDSFGELVPGSMINGAVKVGNELGLTEFIDAYHFPSQQISLVLAGQTEPSLGYYQMTYDEIFPWQVGDSLQYSGSNPGPFSGVYTLSHQLLVVTDRIETADSVWIYFDDELEIIQSPDNYTGSPMLIGYPNPIIFRKGEPVVSLPIGGTSDFGTTLVEENSDFCGERREYQLWGSWTNYCDQCDCVIGYDGFFVNLENIRYLEGLGMYSRNIVPYGIPIGPGVYLNYASVGGISCGSFIPVNTLEIEEVSLSLFPNPGQDILHITSSEVLNRIDIYDSYGRYVMTGSFSGKSYDMDIFSLPAGIYMIRAFGEEDKGWCKAFEKL